MDRKRALDEDGMEVAPVPLKTAKTSPPELDVTESDADDERSTTETEASAAEDTDEDSPIVETLNPLLVEVIVAKVFENLSLETLTTTRLVCKTWRKVSLPVWRSSSTLFIQWNNGQVQLCGKEGEASSSSSSTSTTTLAQFLEYWERDDCSSIPFKQVHLESWRFGAEPTLEVSMQLQLSRFWQLVGSRMTKLTIYGGSSTTAAHFLWTLTQSCRNLETLVLHDFTFTSRHLWFKRLNRESGFVYRPPVLGEHPKLKSLCISSSRKNTSMRLRISYLELLSHFPHLEYIKLKNEYLWFGEDTLDLLRAVQTIRLEDHLKLPIKQLVVEPDYSIERGRIWIFTEIINMLEELRIPLQAIKLALHPNIVRNVKNFLNDFGANLIRLTTSGSPRPRWNFPFGIKHDNLQELVMADSFCRSFEFIKFTPNLRSLNIYGNASRVAQQVGRLLPTIQESSLVANASDVEMVDVQLLKLKSLKMNIIVPEEDLKRLAKWLPNVENLSMILNDEKFSIVCQKWQKLVRLECILSCLTDVGVTGMKFGRTSGTGCGWVPVAGKRNLPGISLLKKLEVFEAPETHLGDAVVFHGFRKMPSLRRVFFKTELLGDIAKDALTTMNVKLSEYDWD